MKKWFTLLILPTLLLTSCAPQSNGENSQTGNIAAIHQETQQQTEQQSVAENGQEERQQTEQSAKDEERNTPETVQGKAQEVIAERANPPQYIEPPKETKYEALVLANGGTKLFEQPDSKAKAIGSLTFGEHVFALLEVDNWIYVSGEKLEGWTKQEHISQIPYDSSKKIEVDNPADLLVLVNKTYVLPSDYKPAKLVIPNIPFPFEGTQEKKMMREEAALALEELFAQSQEEGLELVGISGYRSFATQKNIFPNNVLRVGYDSANQFSAFPGESEHQTGLAMDVSTSKVKFSLVEAFGETAEGKWLKENAHQFGFIIRYPQGQESITGYTYEPWHLRYVGREAAQEIYDQGITLEDYLGK